MKGRESDKRQKTGDRGWLRFLLFPLTFIPSHKGRGEKRVGAVASCWLLVVGCWSLGNAQITFLKTFGGASYDWGHSVQQTSDGGYIVAGRTNSFGAGGYDFYLIRTDELGNALWTKTIGDTLDDAAGSIQQTLDGGYVIAGSTKSFGAGNWDISLVKTNAGGDVVWSKTYGGAADEGVYTGRCVQQTDDGGYIVAGSTYSYGAGSCDVCLVKTDELGDTLWTKTFGNTSIDDGSSVQQTTDGGYIVTGRTFDTNYPYRSNVYLIKTDATGNQVWSRTYGNTGDFETGCCARELTDGGYVIAGNAERYGAGGYGAYLIRTDSIGDTLWTRVLFYGDARSVRQTADGNFIVAGKAGGGSATDVTLTKVGPGGNTIWNRVFFYSGGEDAGIEVEQTTDGGYIVTGFTNSIGFYEVFLIKTDADGIIGVAEENTKAIPRGLCLFQNSPNPSRNTATISYGTPEDAHLAINVYDPTGKKVRSLVSGRVTAGYHIVTWNGSDDQGRSLPSGIYFYTLETQGVKERKNLLLMR